MPLTLPCTPITVKPLQPSIAIQQNNQVYHVQKTIINLLTLLTQSEQAYEDLQSKTGLPAKQIAGLLQWGEEKGLWYKEPSSQRYNISSTGELLMHLPHSLEALLKETPPAIAPSQSGIPEILLDPELLCRIRQEMDQHIIGEYANKLLLFLIFLSKDLGPENAQACFIMGVSSSGKSHLMHNVLSYFPEDQVIWLTRSSAHGLEYYFKGKDLTGFILAVEEAPGVQEAQPSIRPVFSEKGLKVITAQALGGGKVVSQVMEIKGCPAFVTTSARATIDDEMSTRVWIISTDESEEQTKLILAFEAAREKFPRSAGKGKGTQLVRDAIAGLRPAEVVIPYAAAIQFPSSRIRVRRDFSKLLTLIKVSAYLHQYQRPRFFCEGKEVILATFADYHIAHRIAEKVLRPTMLGLPEGVLRVYEICKQLAESGEITSAAVTEHSEYSQGTARHYLNRLVKARLLVKEDTQREHRYRLIDEEELELGGISALEERFGVKEFKEWLKQIGNVGIGYEQLQGYVYDPLAEMRKATEAGEEPVQAELSEEVEFPLDDALQFRRAVEKSFKAVEQEFGQAIPIPTIIKQLQARGIEDAEHVIERMLSDGEAYEPRNGYIRRVMGARG
jgi:hypothetical protein